MGSRSLKSNGKTLTGLLVIFSVVITAGCKLKPLKIDPCAVSADIDMINECRAIPINQPGKAEYYRAMGAGDICITSDEYAAVQKAYREIMRRCGDRCQ